jgi:arginyl-tRNA--protein-N-Asp/Glu arginylyltransferase
VTSNARLDQLRFYITTPTPCSYLPGRRAATMFVDPFSQMTMETYSRLALHGFRRSGEHVYKPRCESCNECIPARIPVNAYQPNRAQKRTWKKNQDLSVIEVAPVFKEEHFQLYQRYLASRHPGGGMDNPTTVQYLSFLTSSWSKTVFYEFRLQEQLIAIAVTDHLDVGLSAVYTFFDPDFGNRSLGTFAILREIHETRRLGKIWLFLGYWIKDCQKMSYKDQFRPLEILRDGKWEVL